MTTALLTPITPTENEVLRWLVQGKTNAEIAFEMFTVPQTIKVHMHNAMVKLQVTNRTAAAIRAIELGLVAPPRPPAWRADSALLVDSIAGEA